MYMHCGKHNIFSLLVGFAMITENYKTWSFIDMLGRSHTNINIWCFCLLQVWWRFWHISSACSCFKPSIEGCNCWCSAPNRVKTEKLKLYIINLWLGEIVLQVSLFYFIYFFSNNQNYQFLDIKLSDKIIGAILYFLCELSNTQWYKSL